MTTNVDIDNFTVELRCDATGCRATTTTKVGKGMTNVSDAIRRANDGARNAGWSVHVDDHRCPRHR